MCFPDPSEWQPRKAPETLKEGFLHTCNVLEEEIKRVAEAEMKFNIDNFDSGPGVEDVVRQVLQRLLPTRYSVRCGVINDDTGQTAGDCDVVIFNEQWFPVTKLGATEVSRRYHFPCEGVYAVGEIKQTLSETTLDEAMKKLVTCHRLKRRDSEECRVTENCEIRQEDVASNGWITNPLYSFILATRLQEGVTFEAMRDRFIGTCGQLETKSIIRCLCVLGHGCIVWGVKDHNDGLMPALFTRGHQNGDLSAVQCMNGGALYDLVLDMLTSLFDAVLDAGNLVRHYGPPKLLGREIAILIPRV